MKIEIDFTNKTILVKEPVILQELLDNLKSLNINFNDYKIIIEIKYEVIPTWYPTYQPSDYYNYPIRNTIIPEYNMFNNLTLTIQA